jgi:hypothetical protein
MPTNDAAELKSFLLRQSNWWWPKPRAFTEQSENLKFSCEFSTLLITRVSAALQERNFSLLLMALE